MKKTLLFILLSTSATTFFSCSSDDDNNNSSDLTNTLVPSKIVSNNNEFEEYSYDANRYLTRLTSVYSNQITVFDFTYTNNRLTKTIKSSGQNRVEYNFRYEGNTIILVDIKENNETLDPIALTVNTDGTLNNYNGNSYTYENGNLVLRFNSSDNTKYTYNSNLSITKNVRTSGWVYSFFGIYPDNNNKNLTETYTDSYNNKTITVSYSDYAVDGNLFPQKMTMDNGFQGQITYTEVK